LPYYLDSAVGVVNDGGSRVLQVSNPALYKSATCDANNAYTNGLTLGAYQTIPLSTIEGQLFKVSGRYKVDFPAITSGNPAATLAQGGVALTCYGSNTQTDIQNVECSMSNRKNIVTSAAGSTNGWVNFEMIISREDGLFSTVGKGNADIRVTKRKMDLQLRCEATYGAAVSCDDLRVESLDTPTTPGGANAVTVIAAGANVASQGITINQDAVNSPEFSSESIPNKVRTDLEVGVNHQVNAMVAIGSQHVYAVGKAVNTTGVIGLTIYNRTPSTLQGTIWAGASSPTSASGTTTPTGGISVSCIDDRGATGTQSTLCQRVPESYGISLAITSASTTVKTGKLTGRGWFGKQADTQESMDLGKCIGSAETSPNQKMTYARLNGSSGICNTTVGRCRNMNADGTVSNSTTDFTSISCSGDTDCGACNLTARRCRAVDANGILANDGSLSSISCLSNFDCLGRCERDSGFVCLKDDDCRVGPKSYQDSWSGNISVRPASRLVCGATVGTIQASPLACTGTGWLSFDATDFTGIANTPPSTTGTSTFGASYNTLFSAHNNNYLLQNRGAHELSGWGRFLTLAKNGGTGWVSLRGASVAPTGATLSIGGTNKLFACRNCDGGIGGIPDGMNCAFCQDAAGHSCVPSDVPTTPTGSQCYNVCKDDPTIKCTTSDSCGDHGPCIQPGFCTVIPTSGTAVYCSTDADCTGSGGPGGICAIGSICSAVVNTITPANGARCSQYGVNLDTTTGKFNGYAWSQDFGWLNFNNVSYGGNRVIQTKLGDIYAQGPIGSSTVATPPGGSSCNATYLITSSSSISGFCSASGETIGSQSTKQQNSKIVPFLSSENTYQNILGRFDLVGIERNVSAVGALEKKNKYGAEIVDITPGTNNALSANWMGVNHVLEGKVYRVGNTGGTDTYNLDQNMRFDNAGIGVSGAGILIVHGNLNIKNDMSYQSSNVSSDLRRLASLTVVVYGNLTIENNVRNIVGAYYVDGTINTATDEPTYNTVVVRGLMIAKDFAFKRDFAGTIENPEPSELIIYDGRLQSNPMPGMIDFASALPNSLSVSP
jgi:hypothetical protein